MNRFPSLASSVRLAGALTTLTATATLSGCLTTAEVEDPEASASAVVVANAGVAPVAPWLLASTPWTIALADGVPTTFGVESTIAHAKRQRSTTGAGSVAALGSICAAGGHPTSPYDCQPGAPPSNASLLSLTATDQLVALTTVPDYGNLFAYDFTGRGAGEQLFHDKPGSACGSWCGLALLFGGFVVFDQYNGFNPAMPPTIDGSWFIEGFTGDTFGDFDGNGTVDWMAWDVSMSAATATANHRLGLFTFDVNGLPHLKASASVGQAIPGGWTASGLDKPLAAGNYFAATGARFSDAILVQGPKGLGALRYDATASNATHLAAPWVSGTGYPVGSLTLSSTTTARGIGDLNGDGADDVLLFDSVHPGNVEVGSFTWGITGFAHFAPIYGWTLGSLATIVPGSTMDGFAMTATADGNLPITGTDLDGDGISELLYVGPAGFMAARLSATDGALHRLASVVAGSVIPGGWRAGPNDAVVATIRRANGRQAAIVTSPWGVGVIGLDATNALQTLWLGPYSAEPAFVPEVSWCCLQDHLPLHPANSTVAIGGWETPAQQQADAVARCGGPVATTCPAVTYTFCCTDPGGAKETWLYTSTEDAGHAKLTETKLCPSITVGACPAAVLPTFDFCSRTARRRGASTQSPPRARAPPRPRRRSSRARVVSSPASASRTASTPRPGIARRSTRRPALSCA